VAAALALLVLGAVGAVQAGLAGASFMFDLEQVEPALSRVAPAIEDPHTPRLARRVFLAVIDGLRLDRSYELPFLDQLRRRGVDSEAISHYPTWSRPNYVSILTGVPPYASGVRTNHHATPVALDSLMDRARAAGLRVATRPTTTCYRGCSCAAALRWVRRAQPSSSTLTRRSTAISSRSRSRSLACAPPMPISRRRSTTRATRRGRRVQRGRQRARRRDADLVILLVGAVDAAGHAHGGDSPAYREAATVADHALARVLARIDLSQDAVIVTADHGHTGRGGHGGVEPR